MFNLTIKCLETGTKITYQNKVYLNCYEELQKKALSLGANILNENLFIFSSSTDLYDFSIYISKLLRNIA